MPGIVLVGHGRIGRVHAAAAAALDIDVLAIADPVTGPHRDVSAALAAAPAAPDAVVVATPTATHAAVVDEVRRSFAGPVLVEKPVATRAGDAERLLADEDVSGLYHAAFGAEVQWAAAGLGRWIDRFGPVVGARTVLRDRYGPDDHARDRLGDSWLDGGINALSILQSLVPLTRRAHLERTVGSSAFTATLDFSGPAGAGVATVATAWDHASPADKRTELRLADGAVIVLDHLAVTGTLTGPDGAVESSRGSRSMPRLTQHYVALYRAAFAATGPPRRCFPTSVERHLHGLLLDGRRAVTTELGDITSPPARRLLAELLADLSARYGPLGTGENEDDAAAAWLAELQPEHVSAPDGAFVLSSIDGVVVGCGAIRRHDAATAEVKRMYTTPAGRGSGAARAVLRHLDRCAAALGYQRIRLETGIVQPEAIALYESEAYRPIANYGQYRDDPLSRCFEKPVDRTA